MSDELKQCPKCNSPYGYAMGEELYACPECGNEWNPNEVEEEAGLKVVDANGNVFRYYVLETVIMDGTEVKRMERGSDEWDLTLFTCTYGGRSRLTVRCKEIK